jgi:hypothetical protein
LKRIRVIEGDFMDIQNVSSERAVALDPRTRLSREKFFSMRPKPLERWLWRQRLSAAAERVFWLHWSEGARSGDWYSQIPLHTVARECEVDVSTVTRAYQALKRLGLIRRVDPGREAKNPFAQATFVTEVFLPRELLSKLNALPDRPRVRAAVTENSPPIPAPPAAPPSTDRPPHPHQHLPLKERRARLKALEAALSPAERERWHRAICGSARSIEFDPGTTVDAGLQVEILQYLAARSLPQAISAPPTPPQRSSTGARQLSGFEVARLRRKIQRIAGTQNGDELSRQVLWSIEAAAGSLRQFAPAHALNIALKKLREGVWTRPNRMPPQWLRQVGEPARPETCGPA